MSSTKVEVVMTAMEKLANTDGYRLEVTTHRPQTTWIITFKAGNAMVSTRMLSFAMTPKIVVEPFLEELCKQARGEI